MKVDYWRNKSMIAYAHLIKGESTWSVKYKPDILVRKACPMFLTAT